MSYPPSMPPRTRGLLRRAVRKGTHRKATWTRWTMDGVDVDIERALGKAPQQNKRASRVTVRRAVQAAPAQPRTTTVVTPQGVGYEDARERFMARERAWMREHGERFDYRDA